MDDDVVGFKAQQAVEKAIKVTLVLRGIDFPRTPDWLAPWAAQLPYDETAAR